MSIPDTLDLGQIKGGHVIVADDAFRFDVASTADGASNALSRYFVFSVLHQAFTFPTDPERAFIRWGKWWHAVVCTPGVDDLTGSTFWRVEGCTEVTA